MEIKDVEVLVIQNMYEILQKTFIPRRHWKNIFDYRQTVKIIFVI